MTWSTLDVAVCCSNDWRSSLRSKRMMQLVCARARARHGVLLEHRDMTFASDQTSLSRRKGRRLCEAKTRTGGCCQVRAEPGKARCRFHGGKSTGPRTPAGRARIAEAQRERWRVYRETSLSGTTSRDFN